MTRRLLLYIMTRLDNATHDDHEHTCVYCGDDLVEENDSTKGRKRFACLNDDCRVAIIVCNGTLLNATVTTDDLAESARDILDQLENSDGFTSEQVQSITSVQEAIREMIENEKERLVSEEKHEDIQDKFKEFTNLSKKLHEKETDENTYQSPNGEEVADINTLYYEVSNVLIYTILINPEQEDGDLFQKPINSDDYYRESAVDPYEVELEDEFEALGLVEK